MFSTRSQSGGLGFASPARGPAQARRCHILHLPNELLLEIMLRAAPWPEEVDGSDFYNLYTGRRALTLVCRRFNRIATPILYARLTPTLGRLVARNFFQTDIQIRTGDSDTGAAPRSLENAMRLLHRTMTANHSLRTLCRDLVFDLEDPHWGDFGFPQRGSDFAEWFTNTESLRFHDGFGAGSMPTILLFVALASTSMYRLKRLAFTARHKRLPVDYLFDAYLQMAIVRFPILRELQLVGLTGGDNMPLERLKNAQGKGQFTELFIQDYSAPESALSLVLLWPARLRKLTYLGRKQFELNVAASELVPLSLEAVWSALRPHLLSLESIRIGSVPDPVPYTARTDMFGAVDFTPFEFLTSLSLSYWATGSGTDEPMLLAPRLQRFEWTFDGDDGRPLFLNDFQQREEDFLRRLATKATKRQVPLREINIVFTPAPRLGVWKDDEMDYPEDTTVEEILTGFEYPWDRMDRLAQEIRRWGIQLTCNVPSVSKESCEDVLLKARESNDVIVALPDDTIILSTTIIVGF